MTDFSSNSTVFTNQKEAEHSNVINFDPLAAYDSQSVGNEFLAFVPEGDQRRSMEMRRDKTIVKNWRGRPSEKSNNATLRLRNGLNNIKDFETKQVLDSERMFLIVLATMAVLLGSMMIYFVMNFHF